MNKKILALLLAVTCSMVSSCGQTPEEDPEINNEDLQSTVEEIVFEGVTLTDRNGTVVHTLSEEDAEFIKNLFLDESRYSQTAPNCLMDFYLTVCGVEIQYHSDCGNLMRFDNGMCLTLTEEEKEQVNNIFTEYIPIGIVDETVSDDNFVTVNNIPADGFFELSEEDEAFVSDLIIDDNMFFDGLSEGSFDCEIYAFGESFNYDSENGILNDITNGRRRTLSEHNKEEFNRRLEKYISVYKKEQITYYDWGLDVSVENVTATGLTFVCARNGDECEVLTGSPYVIQKFTDNADNSFGPITELFWTMEAFSVGSGESFRWDINWENTYGILPDGLYSITKSFSGPYSNEKEKTSDYGAYFVVDTDGSFYKEDPWGFSIEAYDVDHDGMLLAYGHNGSSEDGCLVSVRYWVEKYEDGKWIELSGFDGPWVESPDNHVFNSANYERIEWTSRCGSLPSGKKYRLGKEVRHGGETKSYYAEFELEVKISEIVNDEPVDIAPEGDNFEVPIIDDPWGIKFEVMSADSKGLTMEYMQYGGENPDWSYEIDYQYWIESFDGNKWVRLPYITEVGFPALGYPPINGTSRTLAENWVWMYGELPAGQYRIGKYVTVYGALDSKYTRDINICKAYYAEFEIVDDWGLSLSAKDVTSLGLTLECKQQGGFDGERLMSDSFYTVEKLVDGVWRSLDDEEKKNRPWPEEGWPISENGAVEWFVEWSSYYGTLEPGVYRIGKIISQKDVDGNTARKRYYAGFEIQDPDIISADIWGVRASVGDVSPEGLTFYITQKGENPGGSVSFGGRELSDIVTGMAYWIEKYIDGEWVKVPYLTVDTVPTWTTILEQIPLDSTTRWNVEWEHLYGCLQKGRYRICKEISAKPENGNYHRFNVYAEFEIPEGSVSLKDLGISAKAESISSNGVDYVFEQTLDGNVKYKSISSKSEYSYVLERLNGESWDKVEPIKEYSILEFGTEWLTLTSRTVISIDWSEYYGSLPAGKYRISKHFSFKLDIGNVGFDIPVEFEIK